MDESKQAPTTKTSVRRVRSLTHIVVTDDADLPRGSRIFVAHGAPVRRGQLALFRCHGVEQIGEWYPNVGGLDWIFQRRRKRMIYIKERSRDFVEIVGPIVPYLELDVCQSGRIKPSPTSCN